MGTTGGGGGCSAACEAWVGEATFTQGQHGSRNSATATVAHVVAPKAPVAEPSIKITETKGRGRWKGVQCRPPTPHLKCHSSLQAGGGAVHLGGALCQAGACRGWMGGQRGGGSSRARFSQNNGNYSITYKRRG